jgi:4-amino-4-deoxy-L-arabinose transferase-like glycosyltransferase
MKENPVGRITKKEIFLICLLVSGCAALKAWNLGKPSFWLDESFSYWLSRLSLKEILFALGGDAHPPLFYGILHILVRSTGGQEWQLRLLPLFCGLLCLPGIHRLGRIVGGPAVACIALFLQGFSFFCFMSDTELRMWSMLCLFSLYSTLFFIRALEKGDRLSWGFYTLLGILGLYTGYLALFVLLSHLLYAVFSGGKRFVPAGLSLAVVFLFFFPWLTVFLAQVKNPSLEVLPPLSSGLVRMAFSFMAGLGALPAGLHLEAIITAFLILWICLGTFIAWKRGKAGRTVALSFWFPLASMIFISAFSASHVFMPRRLEFLCPPMFIMMSAAAADLFRRGGAARLLACGALAAFLAVNALSFSNYFNGAYYWRQDWRSPVEFVRQNQLRGDVLLFLPVYGQMSFNYYYDREGLSYEIGPSFIRLVFSGGYYSRGGLPEEAFDRPDIRLLEELFGRYERVILVANYGFVYDPEGKLFGWLDRNAVLMRGVRTDSFSPGGAISVGIFRKK